MTNPSGFANACAYPKTNPGMFRAHSLTNAESGISTPLLGDMILSGSPFTQTIGGSVDLPTYEIKLPGEKRILLDRVAIIGIGSNCSPDVLIGKFRKKNVGGDFLVAQSEIPNHAVVHGAFFGMAGTVPATVMPHQGTTTSITVGFYTAEQAVALTETEWNYDLVQSGFTPVVKQESGLAVEQGAAFYVSPWGALTTDGVNPVALDAIPSATTLQKATSLEAMTTIAQILGQKNVEEFYDSLPGDDEADIQRRLKYIFDIQAQNALPAKIAGTQIQKADIGDACRRGGWELPAIAYF